MHQHVKSKKVKQEEAMKKYVSGSFKKLLFCLIFFGTVLFADIVILVLKLVSASVSEPLRYLAFGLLILFVLFLFFSLAAKSRYLTVDDRQISLPRGANVNGKIVSSRTVVEFSSISYFDSTFRKGDPLVFALIISLLGGVSAGDTTFYSLKLTNGDKVTFTLFEFGEESEKEIVSTIKRRATLENDCL